MVFRDGKDARCRLVRWALAPVVVLALAALGAGAAWGQSNTPTTSTWVTNGPVHAIACTSTTVYIGGDFTRIGPSTTTTGWLTRTYIAALDRKTGQATAWNPGADGSVYALAVTSSTIFVGGYFSAIGGQPLPAVAALDIDTGIPRPWSPNPSYHEIIHNPDLGIYGSYHSFRYSLNIKSLAVATGMVYLAGDFTRIGGKDCMLHAALNASTGQALNWKSNYTLDRYIDNFYVIDIWTKQVCGIELHYQDSNVNCLKTLGDAVCIAGGKESEVDTKRDGYPPYHSYARNGFIQRSGIGANWTITPDDYVHALALSDSKTYAGGIFNSIGGQPRPYLAELDAAGSATSWNASPDKNVDELELYRGFLYTGGAFTRIGGQPRRYLAALNVRNGQAMPWDPNPDSTCNVILGDGDDLFVGGKFKTIGGRSQPYFARFALPFGHALSAPDLLEITAVQTDQVTLAWSDNATSETGYKIFVDPGSTAPSTLRAVTAANATTHTVTGLTPNTLYAFQVTATDGTTDSARSPLLSRTTLATAPIIGINVVCDRTTGTLMPAGTVLSCTNPAGFGSGTNGGDPFRVSKFRYAWDNAATHAFTGREETWSEDPLTFAMGLEGNVYLHLQSINAEGAAGATLDFGPFCFGPALDLWETPNPEMWVTDGPVYAIACTPTTIYIGGNFSKVGPSTTTNGWVARKNLAALDAATGQAKAWNPSATNPIKSLAVYDGVVYAGSGGITAYDAKTGVSRGTSIGLQYIYTHEDIVNNRIMNHYHHTYTDVYGSTQVEALAAADGLVYLGGAFTRLGGLTRNFIGAVDATTGLPANWSPGLVPPYREDEWAADLDYTYRYYRYNDSLISDVKLSNGRVYLAGSHTYEWYRYENHYTGPNSGSYGGSSTISGILMCVLANGQVMNWDLQPNGPVNALAVGGAAVYAGGRFTRIGGLTRNKLAALDGTSGQVLEWNPQLTGTVKTLAAWGSMLYAGGDFSSLGGEARGSLGALSTVTGAALPWSPDVNSTVSAMALCGSRLYVGGSFTTVDGQSRPYFACFDPDTRPKVSLAIVSADGTSHTPSGVMEYTSGTLVRITGRDAVEDSLGTTRRVCTGWTAEGAAPSSGTGTVVTFTLDRPTTLTWQWKTQYKLNATALPADGGTVMLGDGATAATGWYDAGVNLIMRAAAGDNYRFRMWSGDAAGAGVTLSLAMYRPRAVQANFIDLRNGVGRWAEYP